MSKGSGRTKVNLQDFRYIDIYINEEKDIVIFPHSKADEPLELADGSILDEDADWIEYANIVIKFIETVLEDIPYARQNKRKLNL